uniref:Cuticle protein n=1 Tax=Amblyomma maculatum TaxID=34609 RepID=G3MKG7_AMBMU
MIAFYSCLLAVVASSAFAGYVPVAVPAVAKVYTAPATYLAAPVATSTIHHSPAVSKATRVTSFQTVNPAVPHTVAKVSIHTPAQTTVHTVHSSVPTHVHGVVGHHFPAYSHGYYPGHPLSYRYVPGFAPYGLKYGYGLSPFAYVRPHVKYTV